MRKIALRRPAAMIAAHADATPAALLAQLHTAFEEFKAKNDAHLKGVEKRFDDVVSRDEVAKISAAMTTIQKQLDDAVRATAAMTIGAGAAKPFEAERREHAQAFDKWFRKGVDNDLSSLEVKARLSTSSDPDGGFVVPEEMETAIDRVLARESALRSLATVRQISAPTYKKLINMGGNQSGWVNEPDPRPETNTAVLRGLEFPVFELFSNPAATQTSLDDARMDLAAWIADEVVINFSEQEGEAFINGDGVARPRGILSYNRVPNASYTWGNIGVVATGAAGGFAAPTTTVSPADVLISLVHSLRRQYRRNGSFLMNDLTIETIRRFKTTDGDYIWRPGLEAGAPSTLLGYPVVTDDFMPDVAANAIPIAFADFARAYLILDKQGIRVLRDPFTNKPNVHFYTTKRVGGGVQNFEAIKLLRIATS